MCMCVRICVSTSVYAHTSWIPEFVDNTHTHTIGFQGFTVAQAGLYLEILASRGNKNMQPLHNGGSD